MSGSLHLLAPQSPHSSNTWTPLSSPIAEVEARALQDLDRILAQIDSPSDGWSPAWSGGVKKNSGGGSSGPPKKKPAQTPAVIVDSVVTKYRGCQWDERQERAMKNTQTALVPSIPNDISTMDPLDHDRLVNHLEFYDQRTKNYLDLLEDIYSISSDDRTLHRGSLTEIITSINTYMWWVRNAIPLLQEKLLTVQGLHPDDPIAQLSTSFIGQYRQVRIHVVYRIDLPSFTTDDLMEEFTSYTWFFKPKGKYEPEMPFNTIKSSTLSFLRHAKGCREILKDIGADCKGETSQPEMVMKFLGDISRLHKQILEIIVPTLPTLLHRYEQEYSLLKINESTSENVLRNTQHTINEIQELLGFFSQYAKDPHKKRH